MPTQAERTESTRAALLAAARELFGARGYAAVGTGEIVAAAGVTRGALYHHFSDKRALFRAVLVAHEAAVVAGVAERVLAAEDPYGRLEVALEAALDAATGDRLTRTAFLDGPAVVGFEEWRAIVAEPSLGLLEAMLGEAMDAGALRRVPVAPLAHLLLGALNEAGLVLVTGGDRDEVAAALGAVLEGLRA